MTAPAAADFLVEIGTEELPPKALRGLMLAFADDFAARLGEARLAHGRVAAYASPRRLALRVADLARAQAAREIELKGPPLAVAFDDAGNATRAALAFADKCGVSVAALERARSDNGEWLVHRKVETGQTAAELLPGLVERVLHGLPVPRRMRWGNHDVEFVRPVHWVVMLHGSDTLQGSVLGIAIGAHTHGHRVHAPRELRLRRPADYPGKLEHEGYVIADFEARRARIVAGVAQAARDAGGTPCADEALYDEVTALTEWPVPLVGRFDDAFLELPREVIVATLTAHQRYFPVVDGDGRLSPTFVTVANIESRDPAQVRHGNERVIGPRLADAAFFWAADRRSTLASRRAALGDVVYQRGLGSLADKSARLRELASRIATAIGEQPDTAARAALLSKCDLLCGMVGEFPELQGVMGRYYALADGEAGPVAEAIGEQYRPRYAGDALPASRAGQALAFADKLDALCGAFALGQKPSGNRDPFGLRRAALGVVRIAVEERLDLDLFALIDAALELQPVAAAPGTGDEVYEFIVERFRGLCLEGGEVSSEVFEAVRSRRLASLSDMHARLRAVAAFVGNDAAESLAAANKRIANILRQAGFSGDGEPDSALFEADAEHQLYRSMQHAREDVAVLLQERRYGDVLARLAALRRPVDRFFDDVMVMVEVDAVKQNRLALLARLRAQFLDVADISRLSIGRG